MKLCDDLTHAYQDELHRPPFPYKFKFKCAGCPNDCVASIARADLSVIGTWKDEIQQDDAAVAEYAAAGLDIQKDVCDRCPTRCMEWDGKKLTIDNRECVRCMHCINVMPKALRPGKERGAALLIGAKAPIVQGALLSSVLVPFVPAEELSETIKELITRIWDFWDEYGKNRERIGELIQRVGMRQLPGRHRARPSARNGQRAARQPVHLTSKEDKENVKMPAMRYSPKPQENYRHRAAALREVPASADQEELRPVEVSRDAGARRAVPRGGIRRQAVHGTRGSPRLLSIQTLRLFADLADKYCGGYLRFTSRNNVEFLLDDAANIEPLKAELAGPGIPGGRHQQRDQQHRAHAGLGPLPLVGHRRFGPGQERDGLALTTASPTRTCPPSCGSRWRAA